MRADAYQRYLSAVDYVESHIPAKSLETWRALLSELGDPHRGFKSVHIAGTSGKGSVAAFSGSVLSSLGHDVGTHTKPYLQTATENISVNGLYISVEDYFRLVRELQHASARLDAEGVGPPLTWAEIAKALPLLHFSEKGVSWGVVEAGVGGRDDITNVLQPEASIITTVSMDHWDSLGGSLDMIAYHKAGIIKKAVPSVTGVTKANALEVLVREARAKRSPLRVLGDDFHCRLREVSQEGTTFDYESKSLHLKRLHTRLLGRHQARNASLAIAAMEAANEIKSDSDAEAVRGGLENARIPGRFELMQDEPVTILDVAHNPEKLAALVRTFTDVFPKRRAVVVAGFIESKNPRSALRLLSKIADKFVLTNPIARGKQPIELSLLSRISRQLSKASVHVEPDPLQAVNTAIDLATQSDAVCVTGSLYLVGIARGKWFRSKDVALARSSWPT